MLWSGNRRTVNGKYTAIGAFKISVATSYSELLVTQKPKNKYGK
jgi:hypothetical protein